MPSPIKFLGTTMKNFSSEIAWGNSSATLQVELVPDLIDNDQFIYDGQVSPNIGVGECHTLTAGSFRFRGLITSWQKNRSESANPTYTVRMSDAREILAGTKVIIGRYYGRTDVTPNVINAFGYWENVLGFGNSLSNEGGMPWQLILRACNEIINNGAAPLYGGRLVWKSTSYTIDLSRIPVPPLFYKIQGSPSVSLLECIQQVCDDAGRDWYCEVTESNVITIKTISRRTQMAYNKQSINEYANSIQQAKSINSGWEAVNDSPTSKLLIGANVSYLYHANTASMYPYWGTDINGNFIYSNDLDKDTTVALNSSVCADFIGTSYTATIGEIRLAMYSEQAWLLYLSIRRPNIALQLGIPKFYTTDAVNNLLNGNFTAAAPASLLAEFTQESARWYHTIIGSTNTEYNKAKRLHQMVQQAGENYMGRSFIVYLPFILSGYDPETAEIFYNYIVDNEGGYVGLGEDLLGMNSLNMLLFEASPGRMGCFATYDNSNVDSAQVANTNTVVQTNAIYVKASVDTEIKQLPFPCVVVHLGNPLKENKETIYLAPIIDWINIVLGGASGDIFKEMLKNNLGVFPVGVGVTSAPKIPNYISIPLRSRIETYGGSISGRGYWSLTGFSGNTEVEQDDNLNPWSYGGYPGMNIAATAKLFQVNRQGFAIEFGDITFPGLPNHSLGDELYHQGSNITNISVSVSDGGFVTNYRLRTFDPRIQGSLAKREEARLQRIGRTLSRFRREARDVYERIFNNVGPLSNSSIQNYNVHPTLAPRTPHSVIAARNWTYSNDTSYHEMASLTPTEALANVNTRSASSWKNFSMMSINGIFRPFTTDVTRSDMPRFYTPSSEIDEIDTIGTSYSLNPFRPSNDIFIYSKGNLITEDVKTLNFNSQSNTLNYDFQGDFNNSRGIGLKTPVMLVGYGFNFNCESVVEGGTSVFEDDRKKSQKWKAGPLDPIYDQVRGCWTFHTTIYGQLVANISGKSSSSWPSGGVRVLSRNDSDLETVIPVYNIHNTQIQSGTVVTASYHAQSNRFIIQSADC